MKTTKRILALVLAATFTLAAIGCEGLFTARQATPQQDRSALADRIRNTAIVGDESNAGRGATEAAIEWADKYAKAAQELLFANKRLAEVQAEKKKLNTDITKLKAELKSYQAELADANAMLGEMKKDLKEWQNNVLGYRKQMMSAQSAQLAALQKILELLGGEVAASDIQPDEPTRKTQ
ncbi:MAG: hypothetical protein DRP83_08535 [Planctomycetota bacterium]|nr:MAG: hypothetical protein DRP83_08535 [Planctomycetota bacterium]